MSKADSIKTRLKNLAVKEGKQFDYLLMLYFIERLLYRISISKYKDVFALKGGLLLYTILDDKARATKDIDMLAHQIKNTTDALENIFKEVCSIELDDAVIFDKSSITSEKIKEDAAYEGVRIKIIAFLDKSKKVLQLDIGFGDIIIPGAIDMEYPSLLDMQKPKIKAYSLESVIAEKFEAMIYLAEFNSRMKDFYDIYSLCCKYDFKGKILFEAIKNTFEKRGTSLSEIPTIFTTEFSTSKEKNKQWSAFENRIVINLEMDFSVVIKLLSCFLKPIYDAIITHSNFEMNWSFSEKTWT